jgi:hypothetical protein
MFVRYYVSLEARLQNLPAPGNKTIDGEIKNWLNTTVRELILNGSEDLGLPVLDPLLIDQVDINIDLHSKIK